jgi:hypothetical protein
VRKLRQKIEHASPGWRYIHTHFGIGYRFDPEPESPDEALTASAGDAEQDEGPVAQPPARAERGELDSTPAA